MKDSAKGGDGRIDVAALLVGKPDAEAMDSKRMACKAMFKAIKGDDYEGFSSALSDYLEYRDADMGKSESEPKKATEPDDSSDEG